jgi:arylsulfatase
VHASIGPCITPGQTFPFTGRVERVDIELGPRNLSPEDEKKVHAMHTAFAGAHD